MFISNELNKTQKQWNNSCFSDTKKIKVRKIANESDSDDYDEMLN